MQTYILHLKGQEFKKMKTVGVEPHLRSMASLGINQLQVPQKSTSNKISLMKKVSTETKPDEDEAKTTEKKSVSIIDPKPLSASTGGARNPLSLNIKKPVVSDHPEPSSATKKKRFLKSQTLVVQEVDNKGIRESIKLPEGIKEEDDDSPLKKNSGSPYRKMQTMNVVESYNEVLQTSKIEKSKNDQGNKKINQYILIKNLGR